MARDASYLLTAGDTPNPLTFTNRSLEPSGPDRARVRHAGKDAAVTFDYWFNGEDARIKARVENNRPDRPIRAIAFQGLKFLFDQAPQGWMVSLNDYWLQTHAEGFSGFHPNFANRIGGSYAADERFGVGLTPLKIGLPEATEGLAYTAFLWEAQPPPPNARRLRYVVPQTIPPGGALTFAMRIRISSNRDWKHLLQPYKEFFNATFGDPTASPVRYKSDYRPLVQAVLADPPSIKPDNPFGFHGETRRLDLAEGVQKFCDMVLPGLKEATGQGAILWALGGFNSRGAMYRPDFDVLPPEVEQHLPQLITNFVNAGFRPGLCARPGQLATPGDWKTDRVLRINAADPDHLKLMGDRFHRMISQGFTVFYLDSFGSRLEEVRAMAYFRKRMGPDIQTFVEHPCDMVLPCSGAYLELQFDEKTNRYHLLWDLEQFWQIAQWLAPGVQAVAANRVDVTKLPKDFESPYRFLFRNHITPLSPDWRVKKEAAELRALTDEFLTADGKWKK